VHLQDESLTDPDEHSGQGLSSQQYSSAVQAAPQETFLDILLVDEHKQFEFLAVPAEQ
jgi:hypothetical protein